MAVKSNTHQSARGQHIIKILLVIEPITQTDVIVKDVAIAHLNIGGGL